MLSRASSPGVPPAAASVFRHDAREGSLRLADSRRVVALSEPLIQALHFSIIEKLGETAQDALYRTGYEWALQDMPLLGRQLRAEAPPGNFDFWATEPSVLFERWWQPLADMGWGAASGAWHAHARGLLFVELRQSIVADAFAGADQPVCHLYAGLFAGAHSFIDRTERHAVEVQCVAMGQSACKFVVGPGPEIDSAEAWRQQGVAAPEIFRRLG